MIVCHCHALDHEEVLADPLAGSGCGGCLPEVERLRSVTSGAQWDTHQPC